MIASTPAYDRVLNSLRAAPAVWVITGVAGFIGSHLLENLLANGQTVRGLDNFETGHWSNLEDVRAKVGEAAWRRFEFHQGDIRDLPLCMTLCAEADYVLHEAALGSVPLSIDNPLKTHEVNVTGFVNVLQAARTQNVRRLVFAASSASYGDCEKIPAVEDRIGEQLSPYALSKYANELYAGVFNRVYRAPSVGLRYFNVFGPRQDPQGPYAAVIPKWTEAILGGNTVFINGDGKSTRDFCFIDNVVQANLLAACGPSSVDGQVFNVAAGGRTELLTLYDLIAEALRARGVKVAGAPQHRDPLPGEVRHSQADISKIERALGYAPVWSLADGLERAAPWYIETFGGAA